MKWILGLDLGPRSRGAVELARWLARATRGGDEFVAVHVLGAEHLRAVLQYHHLDEVLAAAKLAARRDVTGDWPGGPVPVEIVQALTIEEGLTAARTRHQADGLIVGRAAPAEGLHLVRLGHVARHLLRELAGPVVIAPPDLVEASVGDGPVTALTSMSEESAESCRFASALATRTGLPLAITHAVSDPRHGVALHLSPATLDRMAGGAFSRARAELPAWIRALDLGAAAPTAALTRRRGCVTSRGPSRSGRASPGPCP
jgi:nucleotide-binding universal stress UspA family protein